MGTLADSKAVARKLATGGRSVLATSAYLARAGEPEHPADLAGHEVVVYSQTASVWALSRGGTETSVAVHGRVRVSAAEGLRAAVLADMGLTIASDWMFAHEIESGAVRVVLTDWSLPPIDLWAVFRAGRMMSAKAYQFAAHVEQTFGTLPQRHKPYCLALSSVIRSDGLTGSHTNRFRSGGRHLRGCRRERTMALVGIPKGKLAPVGPVLHYCAPPITPLGSGLTSRGPTDWAPREARLRL